MNVRARSSRCDTPSRVRVPVTHLSIFLSFTLAACGEAAPQIANDAGPPASPVDARVADRSAETSADASAADAVAPCSASCPDLGHALYSSGFTRSIWVNSFDPSQSYAAHGVFNPEVPIDATGYGARYGMTLTGSGTLSIDASGDFSATGTAHNPNPIEADGSVEIDLLRDGLMADSAVVAFSCAPLSDCPWSVHYSTKQDSTHTWTLHVYRHVEGSPCGGELTPDLNGACHDALVAHFHLPSNYVFTTTDEMDINYTARPYGTTTALCAVIFPLCNGGPEP